MKLELKSSTTSTDGVSVNYGYMNTPNDVVIELGGDHVKVDGCNLTDEGEFVPAPGFRNQDELDNLRLIQSRIREYCNMTLNFPVTQPGQKFCASEILNILNGAIE